MRIRNRGGDFDFEFDLDLCTLEVRLTQSGRRLQPGGSMVPVETSAEWVLETPDEETVRHLVELTRELRIARDRPAIGTSTADVVRSLEKLAKVLRDSGIGSE